MITCIIVDDEILCIERMQSLLSNFTEIKVVACEHIPDCAVKVILNQRPDIVFLDIEMPGMSAFDVVEEVRSRKCHPFFIFTTAFEHYAIKAIRESIFDYLLKPIDIDELKEVIIKYKNFRSSGKTAVPNFHEKKTIQAPILSYREKEVLMLIMQGKTSREIAEILFISKTTVDTHRRNILEKTGARNSNELITLVLEKGWV